MKWNSIRKVLTWWIFLFLVVVLGYISRQPFKRKLIQFQMVQAEKGYQGVLRDTYTQHIASALCLNKSNSTILPKDTLGQIDKLPFVVPLESTNLINVGFMKYSTPKLQVSTKRVLDELASRFRNKLKKNSLPKAKLVFTSMMRSRNSQRQLLKVYPKSPVEAPHLYGYTFNVSYQNFQKINVFRDSLDGTNLKQLLDETLIEMHTEKKIWVTGSPTGSFFTVTLRCSS